MRRIVEYGFCSSIAGSNFESDSLASEVNKALKLNIGWEPQGGMVPIVTKDGPVMVQTMVRFEQVGRAADAAGEKQK